MSLASHALYFQIKNHFSVPFTILKYCQTSRSLQSIGLVKPEEDFDVTLEAYRYDSSMWLPCGLCVTFSVPSADVLCMRLVLPCSSHVLLCPTGASCLCALRVSWKDNTIHPLLVWPGRSRCTTAQRCTHCCNVQQTAMAFCL